MLHAKSSARLNDKERMEIIESPAHVGYECEYQIVFILKYRRKVIFGKL